MPTHSKKRQDTIKENVEPVKRLRFDLDDDQSVDESAAVSVGDDSDSDELLYTKTQKECNSSDNEEESESDNDTKEEFDHIETDFECFDPSENFYHGIRHFMVEQIIPGLGMKDKKRKLRKKNKVNEIDMHSVTSDDHKIDDSLMNSLSQITTSSIPPLASRLSDCVCNQGNIGTVLCVPNDTGTQPESVVGFSTLLNFDQYDTNGLKEIKIALLNSARQRLEIRPFSIFKAIIDPNPTPVPISRNKLRLNKKRGIPIPESIGGEKQVVGLFLNERLVNLPHEVVPMILNSLKDDVTWSQTTSECDQEERPYYFFTHLIGISRCFILSEEKKLKDRKNQVPRLFKLAFPKFEDEMFVKHSLLHFTIPTSFTTRVSLDSSKNLVDVPEHRLVFVLPYSKLNNVIEDVEDILKKL